MEETEKPIRLDFKVDDKVEVSFPLDEMPTDERLYEILTDTYVYLRISPHFKQECILSVYENDEFVKDVEFRKL